MQTMGAGIEHSRRHIDPSIGDAFDKIKSDIATRIVVPPLSAYSALDGVCGLLAKKAIRNTISRVAPRR